MGVLLGGNEVLEGGVLWLMRYAGGERKGGEKEGRVENEFAIATLPIKVPGQYSLATFWRLDHAREMRTSGPRESIDHHSSISTPIHSNLFEPSRRHVLSTEPTYF